MRALAAAGLAALTLAFPLSAGAGLHPVIVGEPGGIPLVGHSGDVPDPLGAVTFTVVEKWTGVPYAYLAVTIDFSGCADVGVSSDVVASGEQLDCARHQVTAVTDAQGRVRFTIVGGSHGAARSTGPCATVNIAGYLFPPLVVSAYDLDGVNGVNAIDLSIAAAAVFSGRYQARCDYDGDGILSALDLSQLLRVIHGGGSITSGAASCSP
jgi:hypothetical protein